MKKILLAMLVLLSTGCDASDTVYKVECATPVDMKVVVWSEDQVSYAFSNNSGTRVSLKDGRIVDYSISIPCVVSQREVESK